MSPAIHNAAFKALQMDAYYYAFDVAENELDDFMAGLNDGGVCGLSVSLPYKEKIIPYLDEVDADARAIGAVNTVKNVDGKLYGYNTDWIGSMMALSEGDLANAGSILQGKKCVVLGAGGAARSMVYGLKKYGAEIFILNRTVEKAELMAREFSCNFGTLQDIEKIAPDIVIQTTSIWLKEPNATLISPEVLKLGMLVMDIVYKPLITPLLTEAQARGCTIITGEKMLFYQALEQFKIWTGLEAPVAVMENALRQKLNN